MTKIVSKLIFYSCLIIFHSFCLSGLIWQITQISVNFFQFDVIKDINVITPEETESKRKVAYVCFHNSQVIDENKESIFEEQNPNFGDLFRAIISVDKAFSYKHESPLIGQLILGLQYCFQFKIRDGSYLQFQESFDSTIEKFKVSIGHVAFPFNNNRLILAGTLDTEPRKDSHVNSNAFKLIKLQFPYTDNCFNYPDIGARDKLDAIANCASESAGSGYLSHDKVICKSDTNYHNYTLAKESFNCGQTNFKPDCFQRLYLTQISLEEPSVQSQATIHFVPDTDASFSVVSKPRIDNIDYVTYILGALGSWIGFSFIEINPVPHFLEIDGNQGVNSINHGVCREQFKQIRRELYQTKRESINKSREMNEMKRTISQLTRRLDQ